MPESGNLQLSTSQKEIIYQPDETTFDGSDDFSYTITDGKGGVSNTIVKVQDLRPNPSYDQAVIGLNGEIRIPVLTNDYDFTNDPLMLEEVTQPSQGSVSVDQNSVIYHASGSFVGFDDFNYTVTDNKDGARTGKVRVFCSRQSDYAITFDGKDDFIRIPYTETLNLPLIVSQ